MQMNVEIITVGVSILFRNTYKEYLALSKQNPFRLKGIDRKGIGKKTIRAVGLNDAVRVMAPRMEQWEDIHQRMEEIYEDLQEGGYNEKYRKRLLVLMKKCTCNNDYSAVKASNMLEDELYLSIKQIIIENGRWDSAMEQVEEEMKNISLQFV